jgi:hypothetical protein
MGVDPASSLFSRTDQLSHPRGVGVGVRVHTVAKRHANFVGDQHLHSRPRLQYLALLAGYSVHHGLKGKVRRKVGLSPRGLTKEPTNLSHANEMESTRWSNRRNQIKIR